MGNEQGRDQDFDGGHHGTEERVILPPMVLLIENVIWRKDSIMVAQQQDLDATSSGLFSTGRLSAHSSSGPPEVPATKIWVSVFLDGRELAHPINFPLPPYSVGGPVKVIPQSLASILTLRFSTDSGTSGEISLPLCKLVKYGAPLCATLWLAVPLQGSDGFHYDISEALARGNEAPLPKVNITLFRPIKNQALQGVALVDPQPDVHGLLTEDMDTCTGPTKKGPTAVSQIKGLIYALRLMSLCMAEMQKALFKEERGDTTYLVKQIKDTLSAVSPKVLDRMPNSAANSAAEVQVLQLQEILDETRRENTRLQVEKAELQERSKLQEEHWREQLGSAGTELKALRNTDSLRSQELDRVGQELHSFHSLRDAQEKNQKELADAHNQLEELEQLKSQMQTQRGQQLYLQRELTLASEELQSLRALEGQRKTLSQDHAHVQDELVRNQVSLAGAQKELAEAREELKQLPGLEKQVEYLKEELKLAREKIDSLSSEHKSFQQDLVRATATSETLTIEKNATTRMLEDQLARAQSELEALRARDLERPARDEESARIKVEVEALRLEKQHWREDLESECHRWNNELEALRIANERQVALQDELAQKSVELEMLRLNAKSQQQIEVSTKQKTEEIEVRSQVEEGVLQETIEKLRAAAPQRLKDLREECAALRAKDGERVKLREEVTTLRVENMRHLDEIRDLKEAERRAEGRLQEATEELERKKSDILNMRAEREVMRTGEVLRQELCDENLTMREELDKLKKKDSNDRKNLQDQLARACEELNVLRASQAERSEEVQRARGDLDAWTKQKTEGSGVVTV